MKKTGNTKKLLLSLYHYFCFFALMAFLITCCMMLFLSTMSASMDIELGGNDINTAAILTFWNVVFLSLVCTAIDALRRKITVQRPVKKIVEAAERIAKGDYSVRIPVLRSINRADGLDEIAECYNRMAEELAATEIIQSDFIANVSHELKTPLSVMKNYATLLQDNGISEEERINYAKSISDACKRLAELVGNILKLNKLESKQIHVIPKTYNLSEQVCESALAFEEIWEEKQIELKTDIEDNVLVESDSELLLMVWNNLISNALKFTDVGGAVEISVKTEGEYAVVCVSDNGCGISADVGERIFDKFYQGDASHSGSGNGLGLALVRRIADIVGADISVTSEVGFGSAFKVKIRRNANE